MKERLRFLLALLLAVMLLFSCASSDEEAAADELPAVEVAETVAPVPAPEEAVTAVIDDYSEEPVEPLTSAAPVADEAAGTDYADEAEGTDSDSDSADEAVMLLEEVSDEAAPVVMYDEFIPVEEEKEYTLDVAGYYDGFSVSEDEFVAFEMPSTPAAMEQEEQFASEPEDVEIDEQETVAAIDEENVPEITAPVMEPIPVPSPREEMKKPVAIITEAEAAAVSEKDQEAAEELAELLASIPEPEEPEKPVPSRSVLIAKNDIIEVPYQGNWWVYLGDDNGSGALTFSGREYKSDKTVFTLRAAHEGVALLHFYKQDIIGGIMVDDYLEVTVTESTGSSQKIELEQFVISQIKPVPPEAEESCEEEASFEDETADSFVKAETPAVQSTEKEVSRNTGNTQGIRYVQVADEPDVVAVEQLTETFEEAESAVEMDDGQLFRRAQELEADDIEGALALYRQLVANYPASPYWTKANNRITYINRFYFFKR